MNASLLFVLGRRLMQLAETALPTGEIGTSVRLVLIDAAAHPGSSIGEITERTGFPQSHVSASVARLREFGVLATEPDPRDRRRTLVFPTPELARRSRQGGGTPVAEVFANALPELDDEQHEEAVSAVETLARLLLGQMLPSPSPAH